MFFTSNIEYPRTKTFPLPPFGQIRRNGKAAEIQVGPEGKNLSREE